MKTSVYSWRISDDLKSQLEQEAHSRKISVASLLESAVQELFKNSYVGLQEEETQQRLHAAARDCFGAFANGVEKGSETVRMTVRERLRTKQTAAAKDDPTKH